MDIKVSNGKYVLAVSGGVDSMVLLHLLAKQPGIELVVAHFNHGIRLDANKDEELVERQAGQFKLAFEAGYGRLGASASEDTARRARYRFLDDVKAKHQAAAIITAHHQDDKIETALLNIIRGTGRKGLSAISDNNKVLRPLLDAPKSEIVNYAKAHNLEWREDITNTNPEFLRNYLRLKIMPRISLLERNILLSKIDKVAETGKKIDELNATISRVICPNNQIDRQKFSDLPSSFGMELLCFWLRQGGKGEYDRKTLERLSMAIKTAKAGTTQPVKRGQYLQIGQKSAQFSNTLQKAHF